MALAGFRGTTYEVQTGDGSRWTIAQIFRVEKEARELAAELQVNGKHAMVRITAKRDGSAEESVILEEQGTLKAKAIKPHPVASAPYCETPRDCLRHTARLAIGRVGRAYLDECGLTPAEFLASAGDLMAVERRDGFFIAAIHQIAKAQAAATDKAAPERADTLFRLHGQLREQARDGSNAGDALQAAVTEQGLAALPAEELGESPSFAVIACMAGILSRGGDWGSKVGRMLDLLEQGGGGPAARTLVDELIAEVLDGAQAITEFLGGLREGAEACINLTALATGSGQLPKFASESAHRLHSQMGVAVLPATQRILLERVARVFAGIKPLTQEGGDADRRTFLTMVPKLLDPAGVAGGGIMAEGLTLRGKMILGGHEELPMTAAIERLMELFPNRAVRLGYLLDLMGTPTGERQGASIRNLLIKLIGELRSVRDLVPAYTSREALIAAIESLRTRLEMGALPEEVRGALASSLDRLLKGDVPASAGEPPAAGEPAPPARARPAASSKVKRRAAASGEVLFKEGDEGHEAYLISEGMVDIYRVRGSQEELIATLGRGEIIGEMSLIDDMPRAASARTRRGTSLVVISQEDLKKRMANLEKSDRLLKLLVDTLVRRLRGRAKE